MWNYESNRRRQYSFSIVDPPKKLKNWINGASSQQSLAHTYLMLFVLHKRLYFHGLSRFREISPAFNSTININLLHYLCYIMLWLLLFWFLSYSAPSCLVFMRSYVQVSSFGVSEITSFSYLLLHQHFEQKKNIFKILLSVNTRTLHQQPMSEKERLIQRPPSQKVIINNKEGM